MKQNKLLFNNIKDFIVPFCPNIDSNMADLPNTGSCVEHKDLLFEVPKK